ncbi:hypothetical protein [Streptomyces sp. NPDC052811]|uniref:hypothetical protein n=1 Tax=Streptomyces sp. NPDC052811 TaxID=3155731 RepID=UPI003426B891
MAIRRARKALLIGIVGVIAASAGAATLATAQAAPHSSAPTTASALAADMPSTVESFDYPNAAKVLQDQKITLKKGDGHIVLSDCASGYDIQVKARTALSSANFCFTVSGTRGYLTMEVPDSFGIWTKEHPVQATLTADGQETVVNAPKNDYTPMGETGDSGKRSMLVELRVTS